MEYWQSCLGINEIGLPDKMIEVDKQNRKKLILNNLKREVNKKVRESVHHFSDFFGEYAKRRNKIDSKVYESYNTDEEVY